MLSILLKIYLCMMPISIATGIWVYKSYKKCKKYFKYSRDIDYMEIPIKLYDVDESQYTIDEENKTIIFNRGTKSQITIPYVYGSFSVFESSYEIGGGGAGGRSAFMDLYNTIESYFERPSQVVYKWDGDKDKAKKKKDILRIQFNIPVYIVDFNAYGYGPYTPNIKYLCCSMDNNRQPNYLTDWWYFDGEHQYQVDREFMDYFIILKGLNDTGIMEKFKDCKDAKLDSSYYLIGTNLSMRKGDK